MNKIYFPFICRGLMTNVLVAFNDSVSESVYRCICVSDKYH